MTSAETLQLGIVIFFPEMEQLDSELGARITETDNVLDLFGNPSLYFPVIHSLKLSQNVIYTYSFSVFLKRVSLDRLMW